MSTTTDRPTDQPISTIGAYITMARLTCKWKILSYHARQDALQGHFSDDTLQRFLLKSNGEHSSVLLNEIHFLISPLLWVRSNLLLTRCTYSSTQVLQIQARQRCQVIYHLIHRLFLLDCRVQINLWTPSRDKQAKKNKHPMFPRQLSQLEEQIRRQVTLWRKIVNADNLKR